MERAIRPNHNRIFNKSHHLAVIRRIFGIRRKPFIYRRIDADYLPAPPFRADSRRILPFLNIPPPAGRRPNAVVLRRRENPRRVT